MPATPVQASCLQRCAAAARRGGMAGGYCSCILDAMGDNTFRYGQGAPGARVRGAGAGGPSEGNPAATGGPAATGDPAPGVERRGFQRAAALAGWAMAGRGDVRGHDGHASALGDRIPAARRDHSHRGDGDHGAHWDRAGRRPDGDTDRAGARPARARTAAMTIARARAGARRSRRPRRRRRSWRRQRRGRSWRPRRRGRSWRPRRRRRSGCPRPGCTQPRQRRP